MGYPVRRLFALALAVGLTACSTAMPAHRVVDTDCPDIEIKGSQEQFTLENQSIEDVSVGAVELCEAEGDYYVRLERAQGKHTLVAGRGDQANGLAGVSEVPPPDAPPSPVQVDAFFNAVVERMSDAGIQTIGAGLGPCGVIDGDVDFDAWRMSIGVNDWGQADETARIIADEMRTWDIEGHIGLSVEKIQCAVLL